MFKRGAFDLDAAVFPVAIRYNKIFVDAFWNSKKQSFSAHLVHAELADVLPCLMVVLAKTAISKWTAAVCS